MTAKSRPPKPPPREEPVVQDLRLDETASVYALWAAPVKERMLVRWNDKLWLIDAALWPRERKFSVPSDRLEPAPSWLDLASKVTPERVSELLLESGIIDAETLASTHNLQHFYQNLMAAYAVALRE